MRKKLALLALLLLLALAVVLATVGPEMTDKPMATATPTATVTATAIATPTAPPTEAPTATPTTPPTETPTATPTTPPTEAPTATPIIPGGVLRLTAQGYQSEMTLYVTVDDDKVIRAFTVDASGESAGLGQKCGESRWADQFLGQTGPFVLTADLDAEIGSDALAIDAVSYATVTSRAIVEAINQIYTTP